MTRNPQRDVDDRLADWVDGRMAPRERERFVAELRVNPQLRQDLEDYERTVAAIRDALQAPIVRTSVADRVLAAIASGQAAAPGARPMPLRWRSLSWSLAAAAALLAVAVWLNSWGTAAPATGSGADVAEALRANAGEAPAGAVPAPEAPAAPRAAAPAKQDIKTKAGESREILAVDAPEAASERKALAAGVEGQGGEQNAAEQGAPKLAVATGGRETGPAGGGEVPPPGAPTKPTGDDAGLARADDKSEGIKQAGEPRPDAAPATGSAEQWGALQDKAKPPAGAAGAAGPSTAGPSTGGPSTAGPSTAGLGAAKGPSRDPGAVAGGGPGNAGHAVADGDQGPASPPAPGGGRDKAAGADGEVAKDSRFGSRGAGLPGRGRGAAARPGSVPPPLPMVVLTANAPLPLEPAAGANGETKDRAAVDARLATFFAAQLGGVVLPVQGPGDGESPPTVGLVQETRASEAPVVAGLLLGWSELAAPAAGAPKPGAEPPAAKPSGSAEPRGAAPGDAGDGAPSRRATPPAAAAVPEPRFVERTWLVEGSRQHVAEVLKQLGEFARLAGCELSNGEFTAVDLPPLAPVPPAAAAPPPPIRVVVRFRVRA